ncbi:GerMN domain-containing protein [Streptomyces sp. URMC 126]|uniref:GerMN domain-containing protein n=1 Tax=Streptomyces sp. URMC 126 TaxID=3423401 RepID=UPI003F1E0ECE
MRRHPAGTALLLLPLTLAACGIDDTGPSPSGAPASGLPPAGGRPAPALHLYFSSPLGLERVSRVHSGPDVLQAAVDRLVAGPDAAERGRGLVTFIPPGTLAPTAVAQDRRTADVHLPPGWPAGRAALRKLVCTAADAIAGTDDRTWPQDVRVTVHRPGGEAPATETCPR